MGDDAIELEAQGFQVTAFDVSAAAIGFCQERFPDSSVNFVQADLLAEQDQWRHRFDFVLEIFTVQALPPKYERALVQSIASFVAPGGQLLVIAEVGNEPRTFENGPPWLLTPEHVESFASCGLRLTAQTVEEGSVDDGSGERVSATYVTTLGECDTYQTNHTCLIIMPREASWGLGEGT